MAEHPSKSDSGHLLWVLSHLLKPYDGKRAIATAEGLIGLRG